MNNVEERSINCSFVLQLSLLVVTLSLLSACAANQSKRPDWQGYSPEQAVQKRIVLDSRLEKTYISTKYEDGSVTLTGEVDSLGQKKIAQEDIYEVKGVHTVVNNLTVRASSISDSEIAQRILAVIPGHCLVETEDISVDVRDGHVTLTGRAEKLHHKDVIMNIAMFTRGVRSIDNQIRVVSDSDSDDLQFTDVQIKKNVEGIVWSFPVESHEVIIQVKSGVVDLSGSVPSYVFTKYIERAVRNAPGVVKVKNRIMVLHGSFYSPFY